MAGVGGGFIMAPYWLIIGLSPVQAVATGSFMALGMGASSLAALRKTGHFPNDKKVVLLLCSIAAAAAVAGAVTLPRIDAAYFQSAIAIVTIIALPLLFIDRKKITYARHHRYVGMALFTLLTLAGSVVFSSVFSILIALVLPAFFNLSVLQSTALRRLVGMIQVTVLFGVLVWSGDFMWPHAIAGIVGGIIGSYVGTMIAVKKGEAFARYALVLGALISSVALVV